LAAPFVQRTSEPLAFGLETLGRDVVVDACINRPVELQLGHGRGPDGDGDGEGLGLDIVSVALQGGNDLLDCDDGPHGEEAETVDAETEDQGFDRDVLSETRDIIMSVCRRGCLDRGVAVVVPVPVAVPGVAVGMETVPTRASAAGPRGSAEWFWPSANGVLASTASC
jgi:hypothetical protein